MTSYGVDKLNYQEFEVKMAKITLKIKVNGLHFSIPTESILWCMFGANLVIPAQISDELLYGQSKVYERTDREMDRQTDAGNDNTPPAWKANG